jgi:hypothetical protein
MKTKLRSQITQKRSGELVFLHWIASGLYLLTMVWLLLLSPSGYNAPEAQPWLPPALMVGTVSYGMLMLWLWPKENARRGRPERLVQ